MAIDTRVPTYFVVNDETYAFRMMPWPLHAGDIVLLEALGTPCIVKSRRWEIPKMGDGISMTVFLERYEPAH